MTQYNVGVQSKTFPRYNKKKYNCYVDLLEPVLQSNFRVVQLCYPEIKHSDWLKEVKALKIQTESIISAPVLIQPLAICFL